MRIPKPFFRASKHAWYVQLGKRPISLGKNRDEVLVALSRHLSLFVEHQPDPGLARSC
jgi:hypothetical protein